MLMVEKGSYAFPAVVCPLLVDKTAHEPKMTVTERAYTLPIWYSPTNK